MLRISNSRLTLTSQGYHFDEHGKKFVRIFTSLNFIKIQVKIQPHKEMHIKSINVNFPYTITDNWVEIIFAYQDIASWPGINSWNVVEEHIDRRLHEIWFV
jgi:hypothetical protein